VAAGFIAFELDLMKAVMDQLVPTLDTLDGAPLTQQNAGALPDAQGVYLLLHEGKVRYIGKTDAEAGLRTRLTRHVRKFEHRRNIVPSDVMFKAVQVLVLTAMDVESRLIAHYGAEWNGSGFGSNDPGRERETTNKPERGFDTRFPVDIDLPVEVLAPGEHNVHEALIALKDALPYTLRFEVAGKGGPPGSHTVRQLLKLIVAKLPQGWQTTEFVSHVILYKESRAYTHGKVI
jgi:hypothetical protein